MNLLVFTVFVVFITVNAEDCFNYGTPIEKDVMLKDVQDKCKEEVGTGNAADFSTCIESILGLTNTKNRTINYDGFVAFSNKMIKNEEGKKILVEAVDECKSAHTGDDKYEQFLACWREKLFKVCENDARLQDFKPTA